MAIIQYQYNKKYHEQIPPQHHLAEEILLGGILINSSLIEITIIELLIESFSIETHQIIYRIILNVYFKHKQIDPILIINTLWELNLLQKIGGVKKILNLLKQGQMFISRTSSEIAILYYINLIKDKYARRLLIQHAQYIVKLAYVSSLTYKNIFLKIDQHLREISYLLNNNNNTDTSMLLTNILLQIKSKNFITSSNSNFLSGFFSLDAIINGFKKSDLIIIAGRPSIGKTSFSLNIIYNIIKKYNARIILFSLEMSQEQILYRLLAISSKISIYKIQKGDISFNEWHILQNTSTQLLQAQLCIDDTANLSMAYLIAKIKNIKQHNDINFIIIDYLQLIHLDNDSTNSRTEELSIITRTLKILAKELNISILVLSQLNRNLEKRINKRPLLSDLRESGCVKRDTELITYKRNKKTFIVSYNNFFCSNIHTTNVQFERKAKNKILKQQIQYNYIILYQNLSIIQLTHNHSLLTNSGWTRNDNLKYHFLLRHIHFNINYLCKYNLQPLKMIYSLKKKYMYDIIMYDYNNFIANNHTILHNSIEQDADLVLLLYRESYYENNVLNNNLIDIIVAKHRNGPVGTVQLNFNNAISTFENLLL